jgi:hypothetical protein
MNYFPHVSFLSPSFITIFFSTMYLNLFLLLAYIKFQPWAIFLQAQYFPHSSLNFPFIYDFNLNKNPSIILGTTINYYKKFSISRYTYLFIYLLFSYFYNVSKMSKPHAEHIIVIFVQAKKCSRRKLPLK